MASAKTTTTATSATSTNLMATSIGLLVVGAALICGPAEASALVRPVGDAERLLYPRPRSDTELNDESQLRPGGLAPLLRPSLAAGPLQAADGLSRSRRWAPYLAQQQPQQPIAQDQRQPLFFRSDQDGDISYTEAPEQQAVRFLAEIFANFDNNANRVALGPPGIYDKWVESNKEGVKDEVTYEKREHVKPCLFNAISCPKYPFKYPNKGFK